MPRDETRLPRPLLVTVWDNGEMRPIACSMVDKREDAEAAAERYHYTVYEYRPASDLAAAEARIRELEQLLDSERRHSSALMARINERTNPRPTLLEVIDDHD